LLNKYSDLNNVKGAVKWYRPTCFRYRTMWKRCKT